ncbi:MAG: hypothetical protein KIT43_05495 [Bauldia sp.]|nr:hypothetical protein [Bauldia sp.]MCW5717095.1 hypothetical protein [Bauldia sp.]
MGRTEDADRLKILAARIAALRDELASLRAERDEVMSRLRLIPGPGRSDGRTAVKIAYGEDGEGLFLAELPPMPRAPGAPAQRGGLSPGDPDVQDS